MTKIIRIIIISLCVFNKAFAQGELRGKVTDIQGVPLMGVTIIQEGYANGTTTDINGFYRLSNLQEGKQRLVFRYIGFKTEVRDILFEPKSGRPNEKHMHLNVVLSQEDTHIQEVEVIGRREASYKNTSSFAGMKTATALKDIPQSIGYVTKELALDQGAVTVNDVVKNISGVTQFSAYNDFSIRGYRVMGQRNSGNLVNGMRAQTSFWKQQPITNIERVEVIKGPASALFGNAVPGGVVNRVTKKPLPETANAVSASVGSFNTTHIAGDFTGAFNKEKTFLYRLNTSYDNTDTFRDLQKTENIIVAPSFSFFPSDNTRLNLDFVYQNADGKLDRGQTIFSADNLYKIPITQSINATDDFLKEKTLNLTLSLTQKVVKGLTFNGIYMRSTYDEHLLEHLTGGYVRLADGTEDTTRAAMQMRMRERRFRNNSFNTFLNYDFSFWKIKNTLLLGYDYFQTNLLMGASQYDASSYLLRNGSATNAFNPRQISRYILDNDGNPKLNVPAFDLTQPANKLGNVSGLTSKYVFTHTAILPYEQHSHGMYIQNQMEIGLAKVLFGLRKEIFVDYINQNTSTEMKTEQHSLLPRVGLVLELSPQINLYSTWLKGYDPQAANIQGNPNTGGPFAPMTSQLYEIGIKSEWFNKRLSATLAVFQLEQQGTLYRANDASNPDLRVQVGEEVSKGFELDVMGQIAQNWSLSASYSYNDAVITQSPISVETNKQKPNTPRHSGSLWTKYIFTKGFLNNIGVGAGFNFVTDRNGQIERQTSIVLPAYQLFDMALYYKIGKIQMQLNVNNIFNKTHWIGGYDTVRVYPGTPRNVNTTLSYKF